jgi:hypothetical protein
MTRLSLSTPCVKTGFVPKLLSRLGRDKSEGAHVETVFQQRAKIAQFSRPGSVRLGEWKRIEAD